MQNSLCPPDPVEASPPPPPVAKRRTPPTPERAALPPAPRKTFAFPANISAVLAAIFAPLAKVQPTGVNGAASPSGSSCVFVDATDVVSIAQLQLSTSVQST